MEVDRSKNMTTPLCQWSGRAQAAGGCFKIQDPDTQAARLGAVKNDTSYCLKIQGEDLRNDCLANPPR